MVLAFPFLGVALPAGRYGVMTQDLLWRPRLFSPFEGLFWICLATALGFSLYALVTLTGERAVGRSAWSVAVRTTGVVIAWVPVWLLWDVTSLAPLIAPLWLAD